ncbi:MAG: hypothetical protein J0L99_14810 [Chitinophagales bacterium]|nr:hypothetical protein [Chitinophagales bacterium]
MYKFFSLMAICMATVLPMFGQYSSSGFYGNWVCQTMEMNEVVTLYVKYNADQTFTFSTNSGFSASGTWRYAAPYIYETVNGQTKEMYASIQWNSPTF